MALQSALKLLYSPHALFSSCVNDGRIFADFVGLSKRRSHRRKVNAVTSRPFFNGHFSHSVKAVLHFDRVNDALTSARSSSGQTVDRQVVNLEDILSERGACGVGFIANLDNKGSHQIVQDALTALGCMEHRGGCGSDNDSGDGSGVMTSIPWDLFDQWAQIQGFAAFDRSHTGVGMVFLPKDDALAEEARKGEFEE